MFTVTNILLAFVLINAWTFVMFGWDKIQAEKFQWRVSEATLLRLALFGGSLGAYAGRSAFRHKTRKQPFNSRLQNIGLIQLVALTFCGVYFYEPSGLSTPAQAEKPQTFIQRPQSSAYYRNCDAARSAGVAPLRRGDPGYRSRLDRDNDGIACEPYRGR
ncbi:DUF1294 domain-containing protein [Parasphingorhabdus sp.]|jgi:uncharacterized membrane protein YsdA (DUF1294 family)|uniref:DUF1294 domain-containing protein n=1 Tax=Parasphingorhabdus sp. TaxID=2709688 RepID=UPI00300184F4